MSVRNIARIPLVLAIALTVWATAGGVSAAGYAEDRAEIENLMAKYLFALDNRDAETYASTFTEDGVLNYGGGRRQGRDDIREMIVELAGQADADDSDTRSIPGRHNITNIVIEVDGDQATARSYWTHVGADENGKPQVTSYGHYEDKLRRIDGKWLFSSRTIFNEFVEGREAGVLKPE